MLEQPSKTEFFRHVIVDDSTKNLFCFMPKVSEILLCIKLNPHKKTCNQIIVINCLIIVPSAIKK